MIELSKPITHKQLAVLQVLIDCEEHTAEELFPLCGATPVRDVIKALRITHGLNIHGRGNWRLDERHICGDTKENLIAIAEAKVKHFRNSKFLALRESERLPRAIENDKLMVKELEEIKKTY